MRTKFDIKIISNQTLKDEIKKNQLGKGLKKTSNN
jgi:hypothetical protein